MPIYVLDRIALKPGRLRQWRELFERSYLPGARARGLALVGLFAEPPVELDEEGGELVALWSLPDLAAFWRMRLRALADPGVERFWRESGELILARERRFLSRLDEAPPA
jgi:hypothetical protein